MKEENLLPFLFGALIAFAFLNALMSGLLSISYGKSLWRQLALYWLCVGLVFIFQALPTTELEVVLFFMASFIPVTLLARIPYLQLKERFPLKLSALFFFLSFPAIFMLQNYDLGFTARAMPAAIACSIPMLFSLRLIIRKWQDLSRPQKFLILPIAASVIHIYNFAVFRMDENAQYWGWAVSFAIYQTLGVLLPAIVFDQTKRTENQRLLTIVEERTSALKKVIVKLENEVKVNKDLIKVVLHDISNPLTALLGRLFLLKRHKLTVSRGESFLEDAIQAGNVIRTIVSDIREQQQERGRESSKRHKATELEKSIKKLEAAYRQKLEEKNIRLLVSNKVGLETEFIGEDNDLLATTVFSNIISNSIKFSYSGSEIQVDLYQEENFVVVDFRDYGTGMPSQVVNDFEAGISPESRTGTHGEKGTGFGLQLAQAYIEKLGGLFEINPEDPEKGALVRVKLKKA